MDGIQPLSLLDIDIRSHEAFRELVAYWHEIRGDDSIPARADFNPLKIPALLPEISMLEYTEDRKDIVFRLVAAACGNAVMMILQDTAFLIKLRMNFVHRF